MTSKNFLMLPVLLTIASLGGTAVAHTGHGELASFSGGFLHPLLGLDHVVAMVALGIWATQLGSRGIPRLPACFLAATLGGWLIGTWGIPLPGTEAGVALSSVALGLLILFAVQPPTAVASALAAAFAVIHGYAHGVGMPAAGDEVAYAAGFTLASALLIGVGISTAWAGSAQTGRLRVLLPSAGAAAATAGLVFLLAVL